MRVTYVTRMIVLISCANCVVGMIACASHSPQGVKNEGVFDAIIRYHTLSYCTAMQC